ncbi:hypothetical protein F5J12DRAFT_847811 [Pisolithus orientalis]|uniref:uncharacterized protein n=1 Tax=Pisolithus orientalis TaxID=936130 RepID=UPI002225AA14|nr:uncharacterized protein F5J12DRAFT_847811 [Pisolithus orientalis]KAI5999356.1 hypothetical protein F5J12DRAFT_847811 [Pisolithus orientalis]
MRMRKLGHGHSVMFFGPLDVDRRICNAARKSDGDTIHPSDILLWAMGETCVEIQNNAPYWAQQGRDHASRYRAWSEFCSDEITSEELATTWRRPDAKTLEELYAPSNRADQPILSIPAIDQRCRGLGVSSSANSNMNEEQEREIVHEIERETQVERPSPARAAEHQVSAYVRRFVHSGIVDPNSTSFILMFDSFCDTRAPTQEKNVWSRRAFATSDYCTVVQKRGGKGKRKTGADVGECLRPVNWILSSQSNGDPILVILSPFEVNELLPKIRSSGSVCLQPRMRPCDDLLLYTIPRARSDCIAPSSLVDQVNLFAGQLYLRDYDTYLRLCRFLCVYADDLADEGDLEDGSFQKSPLPFLKHVTNLRRRGMSFAPTHIGRILNGRLLKEEDFEDQLDTE